MPRSVLEGEVQPHNFHTRNGSFAFLYSFKLLYERKYWCLLGLYCLTSPFYEKVNVNEGKIWHSVFYGEEFWSGVLEWSIGVEWSGE